MRLQREFDRGARCNSEVELAPSKFGKALKSKSFEGPRQNKGQRTLDHVHPTAPGRAASEA